MANINSLIKHLARPREVYFLMVAYLFSLGFDRELSLAKIEDGLIKQLLIAANTFLANLTSLGHPLNSLFLLATVYLVIRGLTGRSDRLGKDILAIFLSLCWIVELMSINLLLLAPIKDPKVLLLELLLFLPIITVSFTWWYWRLNYRSSIDGNSEVEQITFKAPSSILNYFYLSVDALLKYQPSYASFNTKRAKLLHLFHAIIKINLLGLTLGRAVSLATSS